MSEGSKQEDLSIMRHSLAHIMATAIQELHPDAKFGVGPVVESGFYYDVELKQTISSDELEQIESKMREVIKADYPFKRKEVAIDEAISFFSEKKQPYKVELLKDLQKFGTTSAKDIADSQLGVDEGIEKPTTVSLYTDGSFTDLCRGPHVESTGKVGVFKLMKVAGAYWRGDEKNAQMQRIYGVAFSTKDGLSKYLVQLEEAKKRDHRKLGQELDLFSFSDLVGAGLPLWSPRGTILYKQLDRYVQEMRDEYDYQEVITPHINKKELFEKSGHWAKFADQLFHIHSREGHEFAMKPMSCPHHAQIYESKPRSYRDLPIRYRESAMVYRDEQSGELSGLSRVRSFTQDDAHVFCRSTQIEEEFLKIWSIVDRFYGTLNFPLQLRLSQHDPDNMSAYSGKEEDWQKIEAQLQKMIEEKIGDNYIDGVGEAAFYGPKLDFISHDALGREWQVATIQVDFNQPEGFDLTCTNEESKEERILMVHAAIMGSLDRFISVLIEHFAGNFPLWLCPDQVLLLPINDSEPMLEYAQKVKKELKNAGVRVSIDSSNESIGKRIRKSSGMKIPYVLVLGEKEVQSGVVCPRVRGDMIRNSGNQEVGEYTLVDFIEKLTTEIQNRELKSLL